VFLLLFNYSKFFRKILSKLFPHNTQIKKKMLEENYLEQYIKSYYSEESIAEKRFYNIGAGDQRSKFNIWSYIDLESSDYSKKNIDIFYDLESLSPIPIPDNYAEVIFSSFVIEHISATATKNLCNEAFRVLKKGGVFHSKVHSYEYAYMLYQKNLISPKIPFECRESGKLLEQFISQNKGKVEAFFNEENEYVIRSLIAPGSQIKFNADNSFIYYNATAAIDNLSKKPSGIRGTLNMGQSNIQSFYDNLHTYVDKKKRQPHQHNAEYFSKEELFDHIKGLGFSEVYFTQPYQSLSPALWEDNLNPIHKGFIFSIEAIK
jgi:hypothetical protein